jgi:hypothetical protein
MSKSWLVNVVGGLTIGGRMGGDLVSGRMGWFTMGGKMVELLPALLLPSLLNTPPAIGLFIMGGKI